MNNSRKSELNKRIYKSSSSDLEKYAIGNNIDTVINVTKYKVVNGKKFMLNSNINNVIKGT